MAESWPDWVLLTTSDNKTFRAVGIASNEKAAITLALADINALLQSNINSTTRVISQKKNHQVSSEFKQSVQLDSRSRNFSNIGIEQKHYHNDQVAVQISLTKQNIINSVNAELSTFFNGNKSAEQLSRLDHWQQRVWSIQQKSLLTNIAADLYLLETLSAQTAEVIALQQSFIQWQQLISNFADKARFEVQSPDSLSGLVPLLSSQLAGGQGETYWLQPELQIKKARKGNLHYAQLQLSVKLIDSQPPFRTVYSHSIKHQQKASSFNKAKALALNELTELIRQGASVILFKPN